MYGKTTQKIDYSEDFPTIILFTVILSLENDISSRRSAKLVTLGSLNQDEKLRLLVSHKAYVGWKMNVLALKVKILLEIVSAAPGVQFAVLNMDARIYALD